MIAPTTAIPIGLNSTPATAENADAIAGAKVPVIHVPTDDAIVDIDIPEKILVKTLSLKNVPTVFNILVFMLFPVIASDIAFPSFNPIPANFDATKKVVISLNTVPLSESNKPDIIPDAAS